MSEQQPKKKFNVIVRRINPRQVIAEAHGQKIILSTNSEDRTLGFTAPETVFVAFGACILTNLAKGAAEMGLNVDDASIEFNAFKRLNPSGFEDVKFILNVKSLEPEEKLQVLFKRATTDGTATNALLEGIKPQGKLNIQS